TCPLCGAAPAISRRSSGTGSSVGCTLAHGGAMILAVPLLALVLPAPADSAAPMKPAPAPFHLRSSSFDAGGSIPARHTCEGGDASPALRWSGAPDSTKSFALIVDDPDAPDPAAPRVVWVHWVLYDLP